MDDLISRSAAIEALIDAMCMTGHQSRAIDAVRFLPTIEAEPVVRCRDCTKRRSRECPMCDREELWDDGEGWIDAYRDRTEDEGYCHMGAKMDGGNENG